jgi:IMP dehydrogenase/GMP reductase
MPAYRGYQIEYVTHGEAVIAVIRDGGGRVVHRSQGAAGTRRTQAQAGEAARRWVKYH